MNKISPCAAPYVALPKTEETRFGWTKQSHEAMQNVIEQTLPENELKKFFHRYRSEIDEGSVSIDRDYNGPQHYINLEQLFDPYHPNKLQRSKRSQPELYLSPERLRGVTFHLKKSPLTSKDLKDLSPVNSFKFLLQQYESLVEQMKALGQSNSSNWRKEQYLATTMGWFLHVLEDMFQPLHNSAYCNWPLPLSSKSTGKKGAHHFFEKLLQSHKDGLKTWEREALDAVKKKQKEAKKQLSNEALETRLVRSIEASYLLVYQLLASDTKARKQLTKSEGKTRYHAALQVAWKPVVESQMKEATRAGNVFLTSAWYEAGKPRLLKKIK